MTVNVDSFRKRTAVSTDRGDGIRGPEQNDQGAWVLDEARSCLSGGNTQRAFELYEYLLRINPTGTVFDVVAADLLAAQQPRRALTLLAPHYRPDQVAAGTSVGLLRAAAELGAADTAEYLIRSLENHNDPAVERAIAQARRTLYGEAGPARRRITRGRLLRSHTLLALAIAGLVSVAVVGAVIIPNAIGGSGPANHTTSTSPTVSAGNGAVATTAQCKNYLLSTAGVVEKKGTTSPPPPEQVLDTDGGADSALSAVKTLVSRPLDQECSVAETDVAYQTIELLVLAARGFGNSSPASLQQVVTSAISARPATGTSCTYAQTGASAGVTKSVEISATCQSLTGPSHGASKTVYKAVRTSTGKWYVAALVSGTPSAG